MKSWLVVLSVVSASLLSATVLAFTGLPYFPLNVVFQQNTYGPPSISAEASGSVTPEQIQNATLQDTVTNGDFVIKRTSAGINTTLGDGIDEETTWTLDFSDNPDFDAFPTSGSLSSARLTLTLSAQSTLVALDIVGIEGLDDINSAQFENLPLDTPATIQIELLNTYSSEEILQALSEGTGGQIPMFFADDAIVSFASLNLTAE